MRTIKAWWVDGPRWCRRLFPVVVAAVGPFAVAMFVFGRSVA